MLKSVIFDLDGVLVDSHPVHRRAWTRLLKSIGSHVSDQDLEFVLEGRRRNDILRHFLGDLSASELEKHGEEKDRLFQEECASINTIPGVREFLNGLANSGVSMAVASCGSRARILRHLDMLELRAFFQVVVGGDQVSDGKPHPAVYLKALHELNVDCFDAVATEDSVSGVLAARAAGLKCLGIGAGPQANMLLVAGATRVVPTFLGIDTSTLGAMLQADEWSTVSEPNPTMFGPGS